MIKSYPFWMIMMIKSSFLKTMIKNHSKRIMKSLFLRIIIENRLKKNDEIIILRNNDKKSSFLNDNND